MTMEQRAPGRAASRVIVRALVAATVLASTAIDALAQTSRLEAHRLAVRAHAVEEVHLAGHVMEVIGINGIVTDWTPARLRGNKLQDLDTVWMRVGDAAFRARIMNVDIYAARVESGAAAAFDSDARAVLLLDDAQARVTLVGYSGALAAWAEAAPGTELLLTATWVRGDR